MIFSIVIPGDGDFVLIKTSDEEPIILKDGNETYIKSVNPDLKGIKLISHNAKFYGVLIEARYSLFCSLTYSRRAIQETSSNKEARGICPYKKYLMVGLLACIKI